MSPTAHELVLLQKIDLDRLTIGLPRWWTQGDTLRFGWTVGLDHEKTKTVIMEFLSFVDLIKEAKLTKETLGFIGSGNLYVFGKCKQECTNFHISLRPKIRSVEMTEFLFFLTFLLFLTRNMSCVRGYAERINIIVNLVDCECSHAFLIHFLERLRMILTRKIPYTVNRIIFFGDFGDIHARFLEFKLSMKPYCGVTIIAPSSKEKFLEIVSADQLEIKYGGSYPDLVQYWPPIHHTSPQEIIDDEDLGRLHIMPFFIYDEECQIFSKYYFGASSKYADRADIEGRIRANGGRVSFKSRLRLIK